MTYLLLMEKADSFRFALRGSEKLASDAVLERISNRKERPVFRSDFVGIPNHDPIVTAAKSGQFYSHPRKLAY